jgi:hypothetical protein
MKYLVLRALHEDINSGWVWLDGRTSSSRCVIRITNKENRRRIYCEALEIDDYYLKHRDLEKDSPVKRVAVNEWYRNKLKVEPCKEADLEIVNADNKLGKLKANCHHSQNIVRFSTYLAIISIVLGIISLILSILGIIK